MAVRLEFDRVHTWFPLAGKPSDLFDSNFKIVTLADVTEPTTVKLGLGVLWKGVEYILASVDYTFERAAVYSIEWVWRDIPTIEEFLSIFGEKVPGETTEYSYSWIVGLVTGETMEVHDRWDTSLLVEVPRFPAEIVVPLIGAVVAGIGLALVVGER